MKKCPFCAEEVQDEHADAATTLNVYGHWIEASDQTAPAVLGDLLGNGETALASQGKARAGRRDPRDATGTPDRRE